MGNFTNVTRRWFRISWKYILIFLWKYYNKDVDETDFQYHELLILLPERMNIVKVEKQPTWMIKKNMLYTSET